MSETSSSNTPKELHACMGLNACKGHDVNGTNDCAGMGQCATVKHDCHTLNNCQRQGGCGFYGSEEEQNNPGNNPCAWMGSCAVPIDADRYTYAKGLNKQKVWKLARARFEERMKNEVKRDFGPSPGDGYVSTS